MMNCIIVGTGGFLGAVARYLIGLIPINPQNGFPIKTLLINIIGAFVIGLVVAFGAKKDWNPQLILFLKVGICGGFTTFSSFAFRNKSADGTRIGLVGSTLCCIERDRSNGCSIRITVYSGKIRFHFDARRVTMKNQAYYHLPGLFEVYELYRVFLS